MILKKLLAMNQPQSGKLIRELRLKIELTQEQFAAHVGVTYPTINRWENGHNRPSKMAIQKLAEILLKMDDKGEKLLERYVTDSVVQ